MKEKVPKNIKMTELSKIASNNTKRLSEYEKAIWKRRYEINRDRDLPMNNTSGNNDNDNDKENLVKKDPIETEEMDQDPPVAIKLESVDN